MHRVFGEPITADGVTVIPAARIAGGGGAGSGTGEPDGERHPGSGNGGGFGLGVVPAGAFVVREGTVTWRPAVDVTKIVLGGQLVAVAALLTLRTYLKLRARRS